MFLRKKNWTIFIALITVLLLSACGSKDDSTVHDRGIVEDSSSFKFVPLSDALKKYSVWYKVGGDPYELTRNSSVKAVYVFEKEKVTHYPARGAGLTLESIVDMSDDEIIETVIDFVSEKEDVEEPQPLEYTLDITLDDLGQDSQYINVETEPESVFSVINETGFQTIFDTHFSGLVFNKEDRSDGDDLVVTRVKKPSILFNLDEPNSKKKHVTIEQAGKLEQLRKKKEEELQKEKELSIPGDEAYTNSCAACHGADLSGAVGPALDTIGGKLSEEEIYDIIINGQGAMPGGIVERDEVAERIAKWLSEKR